eukprot:1162285-Rhodomonas_salina.2
MRAPRFTLRAASHADDRPAAASRSGDGDGDERDASDSEEESRIARAKPTPESTSTATAEAEPRPSVMPCTVLWSADETEGGESWPRMRRREGGGDSDGEREASAACFCPGGGVGGCGGGRVRSATTRRQLLPESDTTMVPLASAHTPPAPRCARRVRPGQNVLRKQAASSVRSGHTMPCAWTVVGVG